MRKIKLFLACLLMAVLSIGQMWGTEAVYKQTIFHSEYQPNNSSYTGTFTNTTNGFAVTVGNANNNNNGWSSGHIKVGRKNNASTAYIQTNAAIDKAITKVTLTIAAINANNVTSIKLYTSSNGSSWTEVSSFTKATGAQDAEIESTNQAANLYYKIELACPSLSNNGSGAELSKVEFYAEEGGGGDVIVKTLESIAVEGMTTSYEVGDAFSFDGTCTATYSVTKNDDPQDAEEKTVTPTSVTSPDMTTTGNKTITVSYTEDDVTKTTTYDITVSAALPKITIDGSATGITTTDGEQDVTAGDFSFGGTFKQYSTTALWFTKGTGFIYNKESFGKIRKITINYKSGGSADAYQWIKLGNAVMDEYEAEATNGTEFTTSTGGSSNTFVVTDDYEYFCISISNKNLQASSVVISYEPVAVPVKKPAFNLATGTYLGTQSVEITCETEGADIYYTLDGNDPTSGSTPYTSAISITETKTLKAIAIKGSDESPIASATYTIINTDHAGTVEDPYSVADAIAVIDGIGTKADAHVSGKISQVDSYDSNHKSITYWISADGTTSGQQLQVYSGKGLNGADFSNVDDVVANATVVVKGTLKKYNSIYEFDYNNQLVSYTEPVDPTVTLKQSGSAITELNVEATEVANQEIDIVCANFESQITSVSAKLYEESTCDTEITSGAWVTDITIDGAKLTFNIAANTGDARQVWMKVTASDGTNEAYAVLAISQAKYTVDYAELPFAFDGGRAAIATTNGMSQEGLDSDYGSSPKLKFNSTGDVVIIKIKADQDPGTLTYDIKGNTFSEGTFKVQQSANGVDYSDVASYAELGTESESKTLAQTTRYVKFIYTEKVNGNVALGNIAISVYEAPVVTPTVVADPDEIENVAFAGVTDQTIDLTYENITDYETEVTVHPNADGTGILTPAWLTASVSDVDDYATVTYSVAANDGAARTAYIKVYTTDGDKEATTIIPISQAEYVAPFDGLELTFPDEGSDGSNVSSYTTSWTATISTQSWSIYGFNTNKWGWNPEVIKTGRKNNSGTAQPLTATIVTQVADHAVGDIVVTVDAVTAAQITSHKLYVADNSEFTNAIEIEGDPATIAAGNITYTVPTANRANDLYYKLEYATAGTAGSNGTLTISKITYAYATAAPQKQSTGLAYADELKNHLVKVGAPYEAPTLTNPDNLTGITYASSADAVVEVNATTGALTIKAAGKAVITASRAEDDTYKAGSASYTIYVATEAGTAADPLSEASAKSLIDLGCTMEAHVHGVVQGEQDATKFTVTLAGGMQFYKLKDLGNVAFESAYIGNGDEVTAVGSLLKYNNSIYELAEGCYLTAYTEYTEPVVTLKQSGSTVTSLNLGATGVANQAIDVECTNFADAISSVTAELYEESTCETKITSGAWVTDITVNGTSQVTFNVADNAGEARQVWMKVTASDGSNSAFAVLNIKQAKYTVDYAELPFAFDGGRADIATTNGMTQVGLDSDYGSSPKLKFNTTGDNLIIHINEAPGKLTYDIKNNSFADGTFTVQESEDGENYTIVASHTEITGTQNEEVDLKQATRYVKFIYTEKVDGNVGLGNITISKYEAPTYTEVRNGLNAGEYYTMCLDKAVTAVQGGSIWRVLSKAENGTDVILEEVEGTLDAGRPYIFFATAATLEVAYTGAAVGAPITEDNNGLIGSFTKKLIEQAATNYIIYNNALYFVNSANVYVGEHRAYLDMTEVPNYNNQPQQGNAPRRRVTMAVHGPQVATGIDALNASDAPVKVLINGQLFILRGEKMYNVNGQLVK